MRRGICLAMLAVTALALAAPAPGQEPAASAPAINPAAMKALQDMGAYLRTLKAFQIQAATTEEDVLDDGQKLQYDGVVNLLARAPNGLRVSVVNDRHDRLLLYDGKTLTLYGKRLDYYASAPAPPTIGELITKLDEKHGISVPLVDLFRWGTPGYEPDGITSALDAGPGTVDGVTCEHYLFRQEGLDWQIWIQKGAHPLPRKLVITTLTDEARPQYTAIYTWNLAPSFNDAAFTFVPPKSAAQVVLATVDE